MRRRVMSSAWLAPREKFSTESTTRFWICSRGASCWPAERFGEARHAVQLLLHIGGFGDAVAEQDQGVAGLEVDAHGGVFCLGNQAHGERALGENFADFSAAKKQRRGMAGIEIVEVALTIDAPEKHGGVAADIGVRAQEIVDVLEDAHRIGAQGHAGERALQHGGEQRRADSLSRNVGDHEGSAVFGDREHIEVIAADGVAGSVHAGDGQVRKIAEAARQQGLLNFAGDAQFLFEALALPFALDQAGVVQDAGGFDGQGVEDLAVELGEGGGAARVQIKNAEKLPALDLDGRFRGAGSRHVVERDGHHGAQALGNDALRALQRDVVLLQVSGDHAGLAVHGHAQRGLRGREAERGHGDAAGGTRQAMVQRSLGRGFEQQAALGVGDRNGAVQHGFEHGVQRQLRMQEHGRFEQQIELAEADGRGFAGGDAPYAGEQVLDGAFRRRRVKDDAVGVVQAEGDDVAFLQGSLADALAVDEHAQLVAAIFDVILPALGDNRRAIAGDAAVGHSELIAHFPAANGKGRGGYGNRPASIFRRYDFEYSFAWGDCVWHRITRCGHCTIFIAAAHRCGADLLGRRKTTP